MTAPVLTADQFRAQVPAFADSSIYTDEQVNLWLTLAIAQLDPNRWCDMLPMGLAMFVAHNLSLERRSAIAAQRGGIPGETVGALASKGVGSVSMGYDTSGASELGGGNWNLTNYGTRFLYWAKLAGTGGAQLTGNDGVIPLGSPFLGVLV